MQRKTRVLVGAAISLGITTHAMAQTTTNRAGDLEEVVVTAERRTQSAQEVPIAATVLSTNEIARRGITDINDLQRTVPSVSITSPGPTLVNIRGVGSVIQSNTASPGVAYYVDGQLIPQPQLIAQSFFDLQSIEVLRGPQGTLTGQNSTGGAIFVRSPDPNYDAWSGYVEQAMGNFGAFRTIAAVNAPVNDNVAVRVGVLHDQRDSYTKNVGGPAEPGDKNIDAGRINVALRTSDERLRANLRGEVFKDEGIEAIKSFRDTFSTDPYVVQEDAHSFEVFEGHRLSAEARYGLTDGVEVRGFTAYQDTDWEDQADGDRGLLPVNPSAPAVTRGRVFGRNNTFQTWINEVNLLSTGDGDVKWVIGAYQYRNKFVLVQNRDDLNTVEVSSLQLTRVAAKQRNSSEAVFGQVNWFATPKIELLGGLRYNWDEQTYDRYNVNTVITGGVNTPWPSTAFGSTQSSTELTGRVGVNYHLDDNALLYLTASKGYKAGGSNFSANSPNFSPEVNHVYELGAKTELLERRLRVNGSVFHSNYEDIQLQSRLNGLPVYQNAATAQSWGAELEVTGQFDALGFNVGAGYLDAYFDTDVCLNNPDNAAGTPGCPTGAAGADELVPEGRTLPYAPQWTINAGVQYAFDLSDGIALTPRLQYSHVAAQNESPFPNSRNTLEARDLFDARLTLELGTRYRIEGYVANLTDEIYVMANQGDGGFTFNGGYIYGAPRTYGVRATVRFGAGE